MCTLAEQKQPEVRMKVEEQNETPKQTKVCQGDCEKKNEFHTQSFCSAFGISPSLTSVPETSPAKMTSMHGREKKPVAQTSEASIYESLQEYWTDDVRTELLAPKKYALNGTLAKLSVDFKVATKA